MEFPEIITRLPEAAIPFPSSVVHGQLELTIGGETRTYGPGSPYFIPSGVVHSARIPAGTKIIEFFEEKDRYKLK